MAPVTAKEIRLYYRIIRNMSTKPDDILPNHLTAAETAHLCIIQERQRRNRYKVQHNRRYRKKRGRGKGGKGKGK